MPWGKCGKMETMTPPWKAAARGQRHKAQARAQEILFCTAPSPAPCPPPKCPPQSKSHLSRCLLQEGSMVQVSPFLFLRLFSSRLERAQQLTHIFSRTLGVVPLRTGQNGAAPPHSSYLPRQARSQSLPDCLGSPHPRVLELSRFAVLEPELL